MRAVGFGLWLKAGKRSEPTAHSRCRGVASAALMDQIHIKNLLVRGIVGINPDERTKAQDILVNVTMTADTATAAASDDIADAVNYRTVAKSIISHVENGDPLLVERLVAEIAQICFDADSRIERVSVSVDKPGALRFAESVGVSIARNRDQEA